MRDFLYNSAEYSFIYNFAGYWSLIIPVPTSFYWQHQVRIDHLNMQVALLDCGGSGSSTFKAVFEAAIAEALAESRAMYGGTARGPSSTDVPLRRVVRGRPCQVLQARGCLTAHTTKSVEALDLLESHFGKNHALSTISALDAVSQALSSRESAPRRKAVMEAKAVLATGRLKARQGQLLGNIMTPAVGKSRGF